MKILEDLISNIHSHPVEEVCIGAFSTFVVSKNCGLSTTQREERCMRQGVRNAGNLIEKDIKIIAGYALSDSLLEASVGIAAINSTLPVSRENQQVLNARDLIMDKGKVMVVETQNSNPDSIARILEDEGFVSKGCCRRCKRKTGNLLG